MDDLISRQAAIDALIKCGDHYSGNDEARRGVAQCIGVINDLPSAQPERKRGKWHMTDAYPHWLCCEQCNKQIFPNAEWIKYYNIPINFCPNCGADMRGDLNE